MKLSALIGKPRGPLILLAIAVGVIPLIITLAMAPRVTNVSGTPVARGTPPAPSVPSKEFVPVRSNTAPETSAHPGDKVALRQLIIATDARDYGLPAWRTILDRIGTPYDILLTKNDRLDAHRLVRPDGTGRYNAILMTSHTLSDASGSSTVSNAEWGALWDYERTYKVRQVSLNTSAVAFPCLRAESEGSAGSEPVHVAPTDSGRKIFDYLTPDVRIPLPQSYVYRSTLKKGCRAQPILTLGSSVVGSLHGTDGREELGVGFSVEPNDVVGDLLGFGLVRWATRGVFLGEQRHWLNVDVDDWFLTTLHGRPTGRKPAKTFRLTGPEALALSRQQAEFRRRYPLTEGFKLNLAFNGSLLNPDAPAMCHPGKTPDELTSYSRCLKDQFRWINHTFSHPAMNTTPYGRNYHEIKDNLARAASIGLPVPTTVLKPPEYSGLGAFAAKANSPTAPVVDHGLKASNKALLQAASDLGVKYLHGDMSFASHRPDCFNCGINHPLQSDVMVVPDWPVDIAFEATTPEEQVAIYYADSNGKKDTATYYKKAIDHEADLALEHLMTGSVYAHTLHQGNAHQYAPGRSLVFDWLQTVLAKYSAYFRVPLKNPDWLTLAEYVDARTSHFAELKSHEDAVWNRVTNAITYTPSAHGSLFITGVATRPATASDQRGPDEADRYGSDSVSRLGLTEGHTVTLTARPR